MQSMMKRLIEKRSDGRAALGLLGQPGGRTDDDATAAWLAWLGVRAEPEEVVETRPFGFADTAASLHFPDTQ